METGGRRSLGGREQLGPDAGDFWQHRESDWRVRGRDRKTPREKSSVTDPSLRLMAVLAHPDDESLGLGGTLAKYASERVETFLVTATRGEGGKYRGHRGDEQHPGAMELGRI